MSPGIVGVTVGVGVGVGADGVGGVVVCPLCVAACTCRKQKGPDCGSLREKSGRGCLKNTIQRITSLYDCD